jgi:hypothetical protein
MSKIVCVCVESLTYKYCEFPRLQLRPQRVCRGIESIQTLSFSNQVVGLVERYGFWYIEFACKEILYGCS